MAKSKQYWLVKSEPETFSYEDLEGSPEGTTCWDGIRNHVAKKNLQTMKIGDQVLFYHSQASPPHVAGIAEVVREAYPDHTAWEPGSRYFDRKSDPESPTWYMVDLRAVRALERPVSLAELKENPRLAEMAVTQRGQRVSVLPVTAKEFSEVMRMAGTGT